MSNSPPPSPLRPVRPWRNWDLNYGKFGKTVIIILEPFNCNLMLHTVNRRFRTMLADNACKVAIIELLENDSDDVVDDDTVFENGKRWARLLVDP